MRQAASGDTVRVGYTGTLEDGTQFDSTTGTDPIELTLGTNQVIPGFEEALIGMTEGEMKTITIVSDRAYGPRNPELVQSVARAQLPSELDLAVGIVLQAQEPNGNVVQLVVAELDDENVTLDGNHPLAGKDLTFELVLVGFVD